MRLLLDTVTFIWAASSPERLSRRAMSALQRQAIREISAISLAEIAIKNARGKLSFGANEVSRGLADLRLKVLPYTGEHAMRLFELPFHHPDPFDRPIIAQALCEDVPVVTCDESFGRYKGLTVVW